MQIHSKVTNTKGFVSACDAALRFRDMITQEAQRRARILSFWRTHGLVATREAFAVSRPTLYRWQRALNTADGKLEALNPGSRAPKNRRTRIIPKPIEELILKERSREKIGKEKLAILINLDLRNGINSHHEVKCDRVEKPSDDVLPHHENYHPII